MKCFENDEWWRNYIYFEYLTIIVLQYYIILLIILYLDEPSLMRSFIDAMMPAALLPFLSFSCVNWKKKQKIFHSLCTYV